MKIGIDARPLLPPLTGIGEYLRGFVSALAEGDGKNRYFLFSHRPLDFPPPNQRWRIVHGRVNGRMRSTAWFQTAVPRWARRLGIDLFWGPRHHLPLRLPVRTAAVVTIHDLVHRRHPGTMSLSNLLLERLLMGPSLRRADRVAAVSRATARELRRFHPHADPKIRVVSPGIPAFPPEAAPAFPPPTPYFLAVGTREPRKNLERVMAAFERMETRGRRVHLAVVGGGGWKQRALDERLRSARSDGRRIHLLDYVPRSVLPSLYRNAVALVYPSLYEGFGLPILEAMSLGTPVITSDRSAMAEVAGTAALRVNPFRTRAIQRAMESLLREDRHSRYHREGAARSAAFSWRRSADDLRTIFSEAAAERAARS